MTGEAGEGPQVGNRQLHAALDCLPALGEPPRAGKREAGACGREAGQVDGAAVARGDRGDRPVDVAAELGRHGHSLGRDDPFDPALCRQFDPRVRAVEGAGRLG